MKTRKEISILICESLQAQKEALKAQYKNSKKSVGFFYLDDLLPQDFAKEIHENFPKIEETVKRKSIRENKYVAFQMNKFHPLLEEVIYAFQEQNVVDLISEICEVSSILPDKSLYAGGLSLMKKDNFLNPHLDNSHDKDRNLWRVFNLLYYVTPNWKIENGGNLALWPKGLKNEQITIASKFNRLVVMATQQNSWHGVSKVKSENTRCCVSNYYFSESSLLKEDAFHVTTFRGNPSEKIKDKVLRVDNFVRSSLRKVFKKGVRENPHQYKK